MKVQSLFDIIGSDFYTGVPDSRDIGTVYSELFESEHSYEEIMAFIKGSTESEDE